MMLTRRELLQLTTTATLGSVLPGWLSAAEPPAAPAPSIDFRRTVLLIELRGGNDGLNTVVPFADPAYRRLRPNLALGAEQIVPLTREIGLHRSLKSLAPAWKDGDLAVVQGLGYPQPNRSHFRGIDIWNAASKATELGSDGWIARILAQVAVRQHADLLADGVVLGYGDTVGHAGLGPLAGPPLRLLVMDSPQEYLERAQGVTALPPAPQTAGPTLSHLLATRNDITATVQRLGELEKSAPRFTHAFPDSGLGRHLHLAARLIAAEADVPVWKLTLDGFDTHAGQLNRHAELLAVLGDAIAAFRAAMVEAKLWDRVLLVTYSEFGRRAEENASQGTDHGTAAPHLLLGGKVIGGLHGHHPDLRRLEHGDLIHTTDFRSLYRSIAEDWWGYRAPFLSDAKIPPLKGLIRS